MKIAFLICCLALPAHEKSDYAVLRWYLEKVKPQYHIVYVHPDEKLLNAGAEYTSMLVGEPPLRVWAIRRSA